MKYKYTIFTALTLSLLSSQYSSAQGIPVPGGPAVKSEKLQSFKFVGADLDTVLEMYCSWTGKMYLKVDGVSATITLKADKLTTEECIDAIEAILAMNNIALVPYGEKFIKVVSTANPQSDTDPSFDENRELGNRDRIVTQIVQVNNVAIQQVQTAIQHIMHPYGKIQILEGNNSMLVTDTEATILKVRELIKFIDQAAAQVVPKTYEIRYADATEIASKLEQIISMAQQEQSASGSTTTSRSTSSSTARTPAGVTRARSATTATPTTATVSTMEGGQSIMIQGSVKVMADERTNIILIFSQKENFDFFDEIVEMLDVEVEPAVTYEVVHLEYADAEEISGTLNELVGAAQSSSKTSSSSSRNTQTATQNTARTAATANSAATGTTENLSKLSENAQILADVRSNSIILMGRKSDIAAIKTIIAELDVMLEQVVIEAAIFEIGLSDGLEHGIQWLYQNQNGDKVGGWNVGSLTTNSLKSVALSSLNYYQNLTGIDTEFAVNMAATDSNARLLSTPVIMTTDNTEAKLIIAEQRPIVTSTSTYASSTGTQSSNYQYKDIGIQLTVTPHINPQRVVVMEINQKADQIGGSVNIDGNEVPIVLSREFDASISVPDRGTIAMGGLITTETDESTTKIPLLGDIPLIGKFLFSSTSEKEVQRELLVLLTPYVMTNSEEMKKETERIYKKTSLTPDDWSWSDSQLRYIPDALD